MGILRKEDFYKHLFFAQFSFEFGFGNFPLVFLHVWHFCEVDKILQLVR